MNKSDYFLTTPLSKWSTGRTMEYLLNKRINLTPTEKELISSGKIDFCNPKIKTFRKLFVVNGISIYLTIRERIEREEVAYNKLLSTNSSTSSTPKSSPMTDPFQSPKFSPSFPVISPITTPTARPMVMSDLELGPRMIDTCFTKFEKMQLREFINNHPPLLWQIDHFNYFLETLSIINKINTNVDELIFYTPEQFDKLFPGKGKLIYEKIRDRFIKKDIVYIKPKEYIVSSCLAAD